MSRIKSLGGPMPQAPIAVVSKPTVAAVAGATDSTPDDSASQAAPSVTAAADDPEPEHLDGVIAQIQSKVAAFAPGLAFAVDQSSGKSVVKVTDTVTNDVVWQFPSVAAIQISKALDQFQKGVLLNRQA